MDCQLIKLCGLIVMLAKNVKIVLAPLSSSLACIAIYVFSVTRKKRISRLVENVGNMLQNTCEFIPLDIISDYKL